MSTPPIKDLNRRKFLQASAAVAAGCLVQQLSEPAKGEPPNHSGGPSPRPAVISSANGLHALDKAMEKLRAKADPLDAAIAAVTVVEDDPNDHSVGLGGLPNEDGIVELDASVMHGPTHKAGAVAAVRNIKNPASVARLVMQRTDHVLLVGEGALRFAKAHGFKEEELLTEESRRIWLEWKESHSDKDNWLSPAQANPKPKQKKAAMGPTLTPYTWGTINCCAVNEAGDLGGVTTTSGLSFKLPGRVGDSPIIGAGLYVDNEVGAAGSTGRGEANIQNCSSFLVVQLMRAGKTPEQACIEALKQIVRHTEPRLRDDQGRPIFQLTMYALAKDGRHAAASIWSGAKYAVHDGTSAVALDAAFLYKKE